LFLFAGDEQMTAEGKTPAERKALNEGVFRGANEKLERAAQELDLVDDDASMMPFLCECPRQDCREVVLLTLGEYENVRANGRRGLAALGHEDGSIERVMARNSRFVMTEKFGAAGDLHAEEDPRG
jgi:hypothetical protein